MDVPQKSPGNTLSASEFNQGSNESENTIIDSGQTLDSGDLTQLSMAVSNYTTRGNSYQDSGVANAYILNASGFKAPSSMASGSHFRFQAGSNCTGASTVNVNSTGTKQIRKNNGSDQLEANDIKFNYWYELIYTLPGDYYVLVDLSSTVDASDIAVTEQQVTRYATAGATYIDTGTANSYLINPLAGFIAPSILQDGARFYFFATNTNTGGSIAKVASLSNVVIKKKSGTETLIAGDINAGDLISIGYNASSNYFELTNMSQVSRNKSDLGTVSTLLDSFIGMSGGFNTDTPPAGWIAENGGAISRNTYAKLFGKIGTKFGVGDGVNTFNVDNKQLQVLKGSGSGRAVGSAEAGENKAHTHQIASTGSYSVDDIPPNTTISYLSGSNRGPIVNGDGTLQSISYITSSGNAENTVDNVAVLWCVYAGV